MTPEIAVAPFPGLRPFRVSDAEYFCGQEKQIEALYRRLGESHFVTVMGVSGCGKSSLVRAGLVPLLSGEGVPARNRWSVVVTRPGSDPVGNLAQRIEAEFGQSGVDARLRSSELGIIDAVKRADLPPNRRVLIIVDQFEELFRYLRSSHRSDAQDEAAFFIKLLLEASQRPDSRIYVVATMRSEYLEKCSLFYGLAEAVNRGVLLLPRMSHLQCERAILEPIENAGASISVPLVQRLLDETEDRQDGLPLLQHALRRIWDRWVSRGKPDLEISEQDFDIEGGDPALPVVNRHLDDHLDTIYRALPEANRAVARCIFTLLSEWDETGNETRRPTTVQEIMDVSGADLAAVRATIAAFWNEDIARTFLTAPNLDEGSPKDLTPGHAVDLSHECLMRQWRQLRQWMALERDNAAQFRRLAEAQEKEKEEGLLSGPPLATLIEWRDSFRPSPFWAERYSSVRDPVTGVRQRSLKEGLLFLDRSKRADRRRIWQRRSQWLVPVVVFVIAVFIYWNATQQTAKATARAAAETARAAAEAAKAAAADEKARAQMAVANLAVENEKRKAAETAYEAEKKRLEIADQLTSAQQREALANAQRETALADARNKEALRQRDAAYAEYQTRLAKEADDAKAQAVIQRNNATQAAEAATLEAARANAAEVKSGVIRDVAGLVAQGKKGEALARLAHALRLDPSSLAAKSWIFDLVRGGLRPEMSLQLPGGVRLLSAAFSPDGRTIVAGYFDNSAWLWSLEGNGSPVRKLSGHTGLVNAVAFSPDGRRVATASWDTTARVWDSSSGALLFELKGHTGPVSSIAFSSDGHRLVTASYDKQARLWDADRGGPSIRTLSGHSQPLTSAAFGSSAAFVVTGSFDGVAQTWRGSDGLPVQRRSAPIRSVAISPDERYLATASTDRDVLVWDLKTALPVGNPMRHDAAVNSVAFSRDGSRIVTASDDKTARVWETLTGNPIGAPLTHTGPVLSAAFDGTGARVVTAAGAQIRIWDIWTFPGAGAPDESESLGVLAEAAGGYTYGPRQAPVLTQLSPQEVQSRRQGLAGKTQGNTAIATLLRWWFNRQP